jgi:hypothetical protein
MPRTDAPAPSPRVAPVRSVLVCAAVFVACALGSAFGPGAPASARDTSPAHPKPYGLSAEGKFAHKPATSCAAASCHGAGAVGQVGSEHSTWAPEAQIKPDSDPHNRAFRVLYNPVSVEMAKKLNIGEAHKADLCLKCHAVVVKDEKGVVNEQILAEGVGCSACHGPAEKWGGDHYSAEWKAKTNREKAATGFVPTGNLVARLLTCAQCHMGDADRDVNHALYAAGHPRITFEAAQMHNTKGYRKHWNEKGDIGDFEVRVWVVGQATQLRAAAELLRVRAERAEAGGAADAKFPDRGTWPEFAGYSCYACHQRIGEVKPNSETGVRNELSATTRKLGVPGWEVWSSTSASVAADFCSQAYPDLLSGKWTAKSLTATRALQTALGDKFALKPAEVKKLAAAAVVELDAWLIDLQNADDARGKPVASGTAKKLAHALANNALSADGKLLADHDWDALASNYLGAAAMAHASGGANKVTWGAPLLEVRGLLAFDKFERPKNGAVKEKDPTFNSPWKYDPTRIDTLRQRFTDLRAATADSKGGN